MKKLLKKLFTIIMLLCIGAPLCIAILTLVTATLWPIDIVLRLLDWSDYGFAADFEEFILACYGFGAMFVYVPAAVLSE
jgi:hypothetical protein